MKQTDEEWNHVEKRCEQEDSSPMAKHDLNRIVHRTGEIKMSHSSNPSAVHNSRMGLRRDFWSSCSLEESKPITDSDLRLDLNRNYISPCTISFRDELLFDLSYVLAVIDLFYHLQQLFIQNTFIS